VEIRLVTSDDAPEYSRLRLEALEGDPEAFSSSVDEHRSLSLDEIRRRIGQGSQEQFMMGAFENGRLLGTVGFYREKGLKTRHKGRVWGVYVTPRKRRTGLARKMLEVLLLRVAAIDGVDQVLLSVASTQLAARHLYASMGFQSWGLEPRALRVGDQFIDEEYMILWIKQLRNV
jgi:ribosomal protein S18 acetylase RimI-like enzyme